MQPLHRLLHRIRWDPEFGRGRFALGFEDRLARQERIVAFHAIAFDPERPDRFSFDDEDGTRRHIPLHRVRTVYKDGAVIWQRPVRT